MDGSSRPRAPMPAPPDRQFSFTDFQVNNPTAPPPGDKLDAEFDRTNQAVEDVIEWVSTSLNSDGSLIEPPVTEPPEDTGAVALAEDWAAVSAAWAEHMPDTIPPNILAVEAITGDHWSSRWWANRAAQIVQGQLPTGASPPISSVIGWLSKGQPDGETDNSAELQAAIDAAAGVTGVTDPSLRASAPGAFTLMFPPTSAPYIVGTPLIIPSNSHIIIAQGATLKLAPQTNDSILYWTDNATGILFELYGTLDGNASEQSWMPRILGDTRGGTTVSGCFTSTRRPNPAGGIWGGSPMSHSRIIGNRSGLVTNFQNWPTGFTGCTNVEISGISMTNCAYHAGSAGLASYRGATPAISSGTYVAATNTVTLITSAPHGIVPGQEVVTTGMVGSSGSWQAATGRIYIALPGTSGSTLIYQGNGGGSDGVITAGGVVTTRFMPQTTAVSGNYSPTSGVVTLTTNAPHYLNYDQMITANMTGAGAAAATGVFQLLDGSTGTTLRYLAASSGTTENVVSGSYDPATGNVILNTDGAHGLSAGDIVSVRLKGTGFLSGLNAYQTVTAGSGTTLNYTGAAHLDINGKAVTITGGTVYGSPTQALGSGAICVSTMCLNSGIVDCYIDNISDIGPCIYGGGTNCYIRDCEITRNVSGPGLFSDANLGRCRGCEISGNYVHDNGGGLVTVNFGPTPAAQFNIPHLNTRFFNNVVVNNGGGSGFGNVDGLAVYNNRFFGNRISPLNTYGSTGEIVVGPRADRVRITNNDIRDPCVLYHPSRGTAVQTVSSGTYNNATGAVVLNTDGLGSNAMFGFAYFTVSNTTSSPPGMSAGIEGQWIGGAGTGTGQVHFNAPAGLGSFTITGGTVTPTGFGICTHIANELLIADNMIGDYQSTKTMLAAIGGTWGVAGICTGNYYGPRINTGTLGSNFPADMSAGARTGQNFDMVTGFTDGTTLRQPFSNASTEHFPPLGISVGYNRSGGRGESNIYVGAANAGLGGIEFVKVIGLALATTTPGYVSTTATVAGSGNTYDNASGTVVLTTAAPHGMTVGNLIGLSNVTGTVVSPDGTTGAISDFNGAYYLTAVTGTTLTFIGPPNEGTVTLTGGTVGTAIVTLATTTPHGLVVGSRFGLSLVLGKTLAFGDHTNLGDIGKLTGAWIATGDNAGTSGTTVNFNLTTTGGVPYTGLDILAIEAGAINASEMDSGLIDASVGLPTGPGGDQTPGGSLFAVDGYANLRLSGALVHGAIQTATLANAGTVTVPQNTSFMLVQNASSLASGTVVMPSPMASSYQTIGSELTLRFQNAVGSLTFTGAAVAGAPTTVLSAGAAFRFIQGGPGAAANTWLPCIPDVSGTPPVGGPYLPVSGGAVTGALTVNGMSTHTAGLTVSGGGSVAGTFAGTPTWSGAHTFTNGGTFSRGDGTPSIHVTGAAATFRTLRFETGGVARFSFGIDNSAESGTPTGTGSNFVISSFNDAGTAINSSFFQFNRLTGRTTMAGVTQNVGIVGSAIGGGNFAGFAQNAAVSGTGTTGGLLGFNQWNVSSDVAALTGQALFNTAINYNFGGIGFTGNRGGFLINMTQTGAAAGSSGAGGIEGLHVGVTVNNTFGGTGPGVGAQGAVFGANIYTRMASATSNLIGTCGLEIDVEANTGATYTAVTGLVVAPTLAHQAPGLTANNVAILVAGQTNSIGLDTAYGISGWALTSGATLFRADFAPDRAAFNLGKGLDLRAITFANDIFAASGFAVGPTGRVRVGTGYFDTTATGAALSADGAICTGGTLTASVSTSFPSDGNHYYADDPYGGLWQLAFVSGTSSLTAMTMVSAGVVKGPPPANPVTLTPRDRLYIFAPATITANLTWDTSRTSLAVQSLSGGKLGFFGATPVVKPAVTGAWAGNTAGKALSTALAAFGLIVDSTTA